MFVYTLGKEFIDIVINKLFADTKCLSLKLIFFLFFREQFEWSQKFSQKCGASQVVVLSIKHRFIMTCARASYHCLSLPYLP